MHPRLWFGERKINHTYATVEIFDGIERVPRRLSTISYKHAGRTLQNPFTFVGATLWGGLVGCGATPEQRCRLAVVLHRGAGERRYVD